MLARRLQNKSGFTLIELMIVITIIGILAAIAAPNYMWGVVKAKEAVLREDLYNFRNTIDQFNADQGKYPDSLQDLVDKKYLRDIPTDPFTKSKETWEVLPPPAEATSGTGSEQKATGNVYDVHSGSDLVGSNNVPYKEW
jgi:general secretion pathway protein G